MKWLGRVFELTARTGMHRAQKSPDVPGFCCFLMFFRVLRLFDLGFLVGHMLADYRIILLNFHFLCHGALVFGRGVEMTCTGT